MAVHCCLQLILEAQKTSVPGDNVTVPNATEKVSSCVNLVFSLSGIRNYREQ